VEANGLTGTTGGGDLPPTMVDTVEAFAAAVAEVGPAVIQLTASMSGEVKVSASDKTIQGMPGVVYTGQLRISRVSNVIVRNLQIVGFNCGTDAIDSNGVVNCETGDDAMTIDGASHHIWIDHCDISDGSDGNLDVVSASDYVTISWTKFWYSGRPTGHQFSNLIGSSDNSMGDTGHLKVTWHHDWWADGVMERMPRVRFGLVHLFNNLYTAVGDASCVGLGFFANILDESSVYSGVKTTLETKNKNYASIYAGYGNLYQQGAFGAPDVGNGVFTPPYVYTLQPVEDVEATVRANAGPQY
jgi:pectate lyase